MNRKVQGKELRQGLADTGRTVSPVLQEALDVLWDYLEGKKAASDFRILQRIQNGLKAALSATPEQYPALREEYRQYAILPEEYAAKLLGCL